MAEPFALAEMASTADDEDDVWRRGHALECALRPSADPIWAEEFAVSAEDSARLRALLVSDDSDEPKADKELGDLARSRSIAVNWVVDVADERLQWFLGTAVGYSEAAGTLSVAIPDVTEPVWQGEVAIDHRAVRLVECTDRASAALYKTLARQCTPVAWTVSDEKQEYRARWYSELAHSVMAGCRLRIEDRLRVTECAAGRAQLDRLVDDSAILCSLPRPKSPVRSPVRSPVTPVKTVKKSLVKSPVTLVKSSPVTSPVTPSRKPKEPRSPTRPAFDTEVADLKREVDALRRALEGKTAELETASEELELVYATFKPTLEAQRRAQDKLNDCRKATLQVARDWPSKIPVKVMGVLDPVLLTKAGMAVDEISSLQERLRAPEFHPIRVVVSDDGETARSEVARDDPELVSLAFDYGENCVAEVLRCFAELDDWCPSGRYSVAVPWDYANDRELSPAEIVKILGRAEPRLRNSRRHSSYDPEEEMILSNYNSDEERHHHRQRGSTSESRRRQRRQQRMSLLDDEAQAAAAAATSGNVPFSGTSPFPPRASQPAAFNVNSPFPPRAQPQSPPSQPQQHRFSWGSTSFSRARTSLSSVFSTPWAPASRRNSPRTA